MIQCLSNVSHSFTLGCRCTRLLGTLPTQSVPRSCRSLTHAYFWLATTRRCTRLLGTLLTREALDAFPAQLAAAMAGKLHFCKGIILHNLCAVFA